MRKTGANHSGERRSNHTIGSSGRSVVEILALIAVVLLAVHPCSAEAQVRKRLVGTSTIGTARFEVAALASDGHASVSVTGRQGYDYVTLTFDPEYIVAWADSARAFLIAPVERHHGEEVSTSLMADPVGYGSMDLLRKSYARTDAFSLSVAERYAIDAVVSRPSLSQAHTFLDYLSTAAAAARSMLGAAAPPLRSETERAVTRPPAFSPPPPDAAVIADPVIKTYHLRECQGATNLLQGAARSNFALAYFRDERTARAAGYNPSPAQCKVAG